MDTLFKRYACPFVFVDGVLQTGDFSDFVEEFCKTVVDEENEKITWEFYLNKVWKGSFTEFQESLKNDQQNRNMSEETKEATVKKSLEILHNFKPAENGGES
jgi:hypothetical protein